LYLVQIANKLGFKTKKKNYTHQSPITNHQSPCVALAEDAHGWIQWLDKGGIVRDFPNSFRCKAMKYKCATSIPKIPQQMELSPRLMHIH
jgi:hypothetical protein